jgi:hypothetical protein
MATFRFKLLVPVVLASVACVQASEAPPVGAAAPAIAAEAGQAQPRIEHVSPGRDSVGAQPKKFEWTAVEGAEGYALLLVNEIDIEIWETTVQATSIELPKELVLESGTYYWAVGAFRDGRQVAYSGRSAFVVLK